MAGGVVDIDGDRVAWSGPADDAPERADVEVTRIDGILMPGMVNLHAHTPMVLLRGAGEGLPVDRWLSEVMWPREARLTPDDVRVAMEVGAAELLRNGITTSVEMYFHGRAVAEGASAAGLRTLVTPPVIVDEQLSRFGTWRHQLDEMVAISDAHAGDPLVEVGLGPHAAYSVPDECLREIAAIATDRDLLVHIHVAEQQWEDAAIRDRAGMSAPEHLAAMGILDARTLAAHSVWMTDDDIRIFAERGVSVAHCPCSNTKHASGIARVDDMIDAGIAVGLGTDGPASHHRLDLFEEMRTAIRLARVHHRDAQRFPARRALAMVTGAAADAIGRPDLGRLTPGSRADMVALAADEPALRPVIEGEDDPQIRLVWSGSPRAITDVWVGGERVVRDSVIETIDVAARTAEMERRARSLTE